MYLDSPSQVNNQDFLYADGMVSGSVGRLVS